MKVDQIDAKFYGPLGREDHLIALHVVYAVVDAITEDVSSLLTRSRYHLFIILAVRAAGNVIV